MADISQGRLEFAKKLVPQIRTVLVEKGVEPRAMAEKVKNVLGMQPLVALDCTGAESSIATAIYVRRSSFRSHSSSVSYCSAQSLRFGGTCFVIGVGKEQQTVPFMHLSAFEIDLRYQ